MTSVIKRAGRIRDFDLEKLVASIRKAGADVTTARDLAGKIEVTNGMRTSELRARVTEELRKVSQALADAYARTLRLPAKSSDTVKNGRARVPERMEHVPDVKVGSPAQVRHGETRIDLRADPSLDVREVWLAPTAMKSLGAKEGARVAVRFLREVPGGRSASREPWALPPASAR